MWFVYQLSQGSPSLNALVFKQHFLDVSPRASQSNTPLQSPVPDSCFPYCCSGKGFPAGTFWGWSMGRSGIFDCSFPFSVVHLTHNSATPQQMMHHPSKDQGLVEDRQSPSGSCCFLLFLLPDEPQIHISSAMDAVKLQPGQF